MNVGQMIVGQMNVGLLNATRFFLIIPPLLSFRENFLPMALL
jgi:hypothetical protein